LHPELDLHLSTGSEQHGTIALKGDDNFVTISREGFINGVIQYLPYEVVEE
jgi:hypothetical protein